MCSSRKLHAELERSDRRRFLRFAGIGVGLVAFSNVLSIKPAQARPIAPPPKPQNAINPDDALKRLRAGNARYIEGVTRRQDFLSERAALVDGQNPYVAVLSCADSRIAPEYAFDTGRGDLFAVRVAGNFITTDVLASLEYAVAVLGTPLLVVMGHERCGAVSAGVKSVKEGATYPGSIQSLATAIEPSVRKVLKQPGDLLENAISQNVKDNVARLKSSSYLLADAVQQGRLKIIGGVYQLHSGEVKFIV
ncbi:carbonic anhydrase [Pseudomonas sp. IPO3774]|uniref:carbonic anhydrase n=1 Tax=Pseudomonas sp. IPO3774 TaxID=2738826 RepID=UPI0015A2FA80|nr:carbonic anhydrase [Pseudomonas sp. IPO3774]NWD64140.1 carbonic anhydrase [Pseudomonas sp. IPO3774]